MFLIVQRSLVTAQKKTDLRPEDNLYYSIGDLRFQILDV
jgi:hypothetical protein